MPAAAPAGCSIGATAILHVIAVRPFIAWMLLRTGAAVLFLQVASLVASNDGDTQSCVVDGRVDDSRTVRSPFKAKPTNCMVNKTHASGQDRCR